MPFLIGTDEAGYSPNLGPLVISASVWWLDDGDVEVDLYKRLKSVLCKEPSRKAPAKATRDRQFQGMYKHRPRAWLLGAGRAGGAGAPERFA